MMEKVHEENWALRMYVTESESWEETKKERKWAGWTEMWVAGFVSPSYLQKNPDKTPQRVKRLEEDTISAACTGVT